MELLKPILILLPSALLVAIANAVSTAYPEYAPLVSQILLALGVSAPALLLTKSPLDK